MERLSVTFHAVQRYYERILKTEMPDNISKSTLCKLKRKISDEITPMYLSQLQLDGKYRMKDYYTAVVKNGRIITVTEPPDTAINKQIMATRRKQEKNTKKRTIVKYAKGKPKYYKR